MSLSPNTTSQDARPTVAAPPDRVAVPGAGADPWPQPSAVLELFKPITWFAPMWAFACGAISSGASLEGRYWAVALGVMLAGPMVCATSQAVNDWFDRHVDAINEPDRPIPSGRIPGRWGLWIAIVWTLASLAVASLLGPIVLAAAALGLLLAWGYSAPPFRFKQNGWLGNAAVGISYEGLAWITGAAVILGGLPSMEIFALAALYSIGAHGIMTLNDFKAIAGDKEMGVNSLPVLLGPERAARLACVVMAVPQVIVIALLASWQAPWHALAVTVVLAAQFVLMVKLLRDPKANAAFYNATGTSLYVIGMMIAAFAVAQTPAAVGAGV